MSLAGRGDQLRSSSLESEKWYCFCRRWREYFVRDFGHLAEQGTGHIQ